MEKIRVELGERSYDITIGNKILSRLEREAGRTLLVTDSTVKKLYAREIASALGTEHVFSFPAGESSKRPETSLDICRTAARLNFDRKCRFAAAGGGVTGDLTGFAAAIYMRGIEFIQIPTTLLAAVDSSVGGKTGADIPEGKNLIGAFHQPSAVVIDTAFLATLPPAELKNGLAEIVKTAVILDGQLFEQLERDPESLFQKPDFEKTYPQIIRRCCELKGMIVSEDECEKGRRAILNYGHTFGHAVELLSDYTLPHGQAVAAGMAAAGELAVMLGVWSKECVRRQKALLNMLELPVKIPGKYNTCDLVAAMRRDKKNLNGRTRVVLCSDIGCAQLPVEADEKDLTEAWERIR
ncbi:MAG: 3-dehydroquinate synthase [Lentisphaeria bacterium]|nr:3-dehydroquinate synthase [Lentisphaeria bacterium]